MLSISHTRLSQNKQNGLNSLFRWASIPISAMLALMFMGFPLTAHAGVTGFKPVERKTVTYKTSFDEMSDLVNPRLDWRSPSVDLTFTIPESAWVENLELLISGMPNGKIDPNIPLLVQFNDAEPITLYPGPYQFDARLNLDRSYIKSRNNKIQFSYKQDSADACPTPDSGAWELDFDTSNIVIKARTRMRAIHMRDLKTQLGSSTLAPKKVKITSYGADAAKLKALTAQGLGLNMPSIPKFQNRRNGADLEITIGTRGQLKGKIRDEFALRETGPRMVISEGHPLHVTITGDSAAEVTDMVSAFATYEMPSVRRRKASPGDFYLRAPFAMKRKRVLGRTKLADIGSLNFSDHWGARPQTIRFDVDNPAVSHGKAVIRMVSASSVNPTSFVDVTLNGRRLGRTQLDARRKSVAFDIPRGLLQGMGNQLTITPDLTPVAMAGDCSFARIIPGFSIAAGSFIDIETDKHAALTDLSRFSASGHPFGVKKGAETAVLFNGNSQDDENAGLRVLTQMAVASGSGWVDAQFLTSPSDIPAHRNILVLGGNLPENNPIFNAAPRMLKAALTGADFREPARFQSAALSIQPQHRFMSVRENGPTRVRGGVAAVYDDARTGQVIGVVSSMRGHPFDRTVNHLLTDGHWNSMEGRVAKWNKDTVLMAQSALPAKYYETATPRTPQERVIPVASSVKLPALGFGKAFENAWFNLQLASARASDNAQNLWANAFDRMENGKDPEFSEPRDVSKSAENTATPTPLLRGRQTDNPVFIGESSTRTSRSVKADQTGDIYQPPALRNTDQQAKPEFQQPQFLASVQNWVDKTWQTTKFKTEKLIARHNQKIGSHSNVTFWAAIMAMLLIVMSLASPKSRT